MTGWKRQSLKKQKAQSSQGLSSVYNWKYDQKTEKELLIANE